ncbi:hypothetical protein GS876_23280 [Rhodococcus hoagii]|nr:hypothetical protein [Prescottella equi]
MRFDASLDDEVAVAVAVGHALERRDGVGLRRVQTERHAGERYKRAVTGAITTVLTVTTAPPGGGCGTAIRAGGAAATGTAGAASSTVPIVVANAAANRRAFMDPLRAQSAPPPARPQTLWGEACSGGG